MSVHSLHLLSIFTEPSTIQCKFVSFTVVCALHNSRGHCSQYSLCERHTLELMQVRHTYTMALSGVKDVLLSFAHCSLGLSVFIGRVLYSEY